MIDPLAVEFRNALNLLDDLTDNLLPLGGVAGVYQSRVEVWKKTARSLVDEHLSHPRAKTREKVAAIVAAWHEELAKAEEPVTYEGGPAVDLDRLALVAANVLADWHWRDGLDTIHDGPMEDTTNQAEM